MSAILVHIACTGPRITGPCPPRWMGDCIEQYRLFNDDELYVLTDRDNLQYLPTDRGNILSFAIEDYHSDKISKFESLYRFGPKNFWTVALTRLMYIENFMRMQGIRHICGFANDSLIYFNINQYMQVFNELYSGLAFTPCSPSQLIAGFMYINGHESLAHMNDFFLEMVATHTAREFNNKYGHEMNDMSMMMVYKTKTGLIDHLPILPVGEFATNFNHFNALFDPASWGQFVGGTRTAGPGWKSSIHYIGQLLLAHPEYRVGWKIEDGLWLPYFIYNGNAVKLNSLHIHSKNTHPYVSKRNQ